MRRYLPHAVVATAFVILLPALGVRAIVPSGGPMLSVLSVSAAMALSVVCASAASAFWIRRRGSRDVVFADLMLWGWLRRLVTERRLAEGRKVLGPGPVGVDGQVTLKRLTARLEARDPETYGHTRRVTRHAERIARAMHLSPAEVAKVRTAAALHDVGKLRTPPAILHKPGALTEQEFEVVKRHPVDGAEMLAGIGDPDVTAMVRHHHERLDGAGYPDGLAGEQIPLGARIIAVADTFDAITSRRAYHGGSNHKRALDVLTGEAGGRLDSAAVSAFLGYYSGRRSVAWSALVTALPQRAVGWLGGASERLGASAASIAHALPAAGAALLLAGPVLGGGSAAAAGTPEARSHSRAGHAGDSRMAAAVPVETRATTRAPLRHAPAKRPSRRSGPDAWGPGGARTPGPSGGAVTPDRPAAPSEGSQPAARPPAGASPAPPPGTSPPPKLVLPEIALPKVELPPVDTTALQLPSELPYVDVPQLDVPALPTGSTPSLPG